MRNRSLWRWAVARSRRARSAVTCPRLPISVSQAGRSPREVAAVRHGCLPTHASPRDRAQWPACRRRMISPDGMRQWCESSAGSSRRTSPSMRSSFRCPSSVREDSSSSRCSGRSEWRCNTRSCGRRDTIGATSSGSLVTGCCSTSQRRRSTMRGRCSTRRSASRCGRGRARAARGDYSIRRACRHCRSSEAAGWRDLRCPAKPHPSRFLLTTRPTGRRSIR